MNYDLIASEYQLRYYGEYDESNELIYSNLVKYIHNKEIKSILEIGCGTGYWLKRISENYRNVASLTGIDSSREMINIANENNCNNIDFREADFMMMENEFENDLVMLIFVLSITNGNKNDLLTDNLEKIYNLIEEHGDVIIIENKIPKRIVERNHGLSMYDLTLDEKWGNQVVSINYKLYSPEFMKQEMENVGFLNVDIVDITEDIYMIVGKKIERKDNQES